MIPKKLKLGLMKQVFKISKKRILLRITWACGGSGIKGLYVYAWAKFSHPVLNQRQI